MLASISATLALPAMAITFPTIDPVALSLGPVKVRWYGLAYMAGLLLAWLYIRRLLAEERLWKNNKAPFSVAASEDLLLWMTFGVIIGGRLGQVLFYEFDYFRTHPLEILAVWNGGMSFHGGLLGAGVVAWAFARRHEAPVLSVMDVCSAAVPFGLFFGRLSNFINQEHWGRPSSMPWAVIFPKAGPEPLHPSQLYEAATEGILLFLALRWLTHRRDAFHRPGLVVGAFLALYAAARIFCEFFRAPDIGLGLNLGPVTAGMLYSLPMLALGLWFVHLARTPVAAEKA